MKIIVLVSTVCAVALALPTTTNERLSNREKKSIPYGSSGGSSYGGGGSSYSGGASGSSSGPSYTGSSGSYGGSNYGGSSGGYSSPCGAASAPTPIALYLAPNAAPHYRAADELDEEEQEQARSYGGAYGGASSYGGAQGSGLSYGGGSTGPAIGYFPHANIGGCAVPLLLSCSPKVVSGHLMKSKGYSSSGYGAASSGYGASSGYSAPAPAQPSYSAPAPAPASYGSGYRTTDTLLDIHNTEMKETNMDMAEKSAGWKQMERSQEANNHNMDDLHHIHHSVPHHS